MVKNVRASEKIALLGTVDPATVTAQTYSDVVDMSKFWQALGFALLGAVNAGDTIVFTAYACDASGNNASPIVVNGSTRQVTLAATSGNQNTQIELGIRAEDLTGLTYQHMKFGLSCGTTGGLAAVAVLGTDCKYDPTSTYNLSTVTVTG